MGDVPAELLERGVLGLVCLIFMGVSLFLWRSNISKDSKVEDLQEKRLAAYVKSSDAAAAQAKVLQELSIAISKMADELHAQNEQFTRLRIRLAGGGTDE